VVCRPKAPLCDRCPLAQGCAARAAGAPESWPRRERKADRPRRYGAAFLALRDGEVGLVRRPPKGLLGGMLALPTSEWDQRAVTPAVARAAAPCAGDWRAVGEIEHVFTHFALSLQVWRADGAADFEGAIWTPASGLEALPSVFLKAARAGIGALL